MNRSEISNEFNFENELDITQNRRDRTENYFSKEGFAFEDFMNIGDKTMKSDKLESKLYPNASEISKKQHDSSINPNFIDNLTEHSIKTRKQNPPIIDNISLDVPQMNSIQIISPKFMENFATSKSIKETSKKEFTLRRVQTNQERLMSSQKNIEKSVSNILPEKDFKKQKTPLNFQESLHLQKDPSNQKQAQYKQLQCQIRFCEDEFEKMIYQSKRMEEETENLMISFNSMAHEVELQRYSKDIKEINKNIEEQRNLEAQLTRMIAQIEDEYQTLVNSIKTSNFPRPVKIRDQEKAIIDQINALKTEFDAIERDDGSLCLSSTLINPTSKIENGSTFRTVPKKDCEKGKMKIKEIFEENKCSGDPRFLYNLKMACLREEWNIYSNSQIQINVSYRNCPYIRLHIGNKLNKDLQKFTLKEQNNSKLEGEIISQKSFIIHDIQLKQQAIEQLFIKLEISYNIESSNRKINLYIPVGLTNFGYFSPITEKEFDSDAGQDEFQFSSGFKPIDKKLMDNITEVQYYMPNLLIDRDNCRCSGLFCSIFNEYTLVRVKQKGQLVTVSAKTSNWALIRLLEFIFSI